MIMIHGWGFDSGVFKPIAKQLEKNYQVKRINLPGYGGSTVDSVYSLHGYARYVIDKIEESAIVVGWSLGGLIALETARYEPDRVKKLVLITTTPCFSRRVDWPHAMDRRVLENFISAYNKEPQETLEKFRFLATEGNRHPRNWIRKLRNFSEGSVDQRALQQGLEILMYCDYREQMKSVEKPVLMIFGQNDTLVPVAVEKEIRALNTNVETRIIADSGHIPFLTHTNVTADLINEYSAG